MRAVVFTEYGTPAQVRTVPDPSCPAAGAVIEVAATGLCRSDWHGWMGHDPDITLPHVPGHEFAGTVVEVGAQVRTFAPGDRVTVPFVCACGSCPRCLAGEHQVCDNQFQPGFTHWGSFAELVAIDRAEVNLVRLPDELDHVTAASLGCRLATAYRGLNAHGRVAAGDWVSVHGCGGVGLSAIMIARGKGARVIAVDLSPAALALAAELGADVVLDAREVADVPAAVRAASNGGVAVSVDALGSSRTCREAILGLAKRGRHVQIGLMVGPDSDAALPMARIIAGELEVYGSHGMAAHDYPALLSEVAEGRLQPGRLVTDAITLSEAPAALAGMDGRSGAGMTIVLPQR